MRRVVLSSLVAIARLVCVAGGASAEKRDDLCVAPKEMKTAKWQSRSENGGMTILIPPGFGAGGMGGGLEQSEAHYYQISEWRASPSHHWLRSRTPITPSRPGGH